MYPLYSARKPDTYLHSAVCDTREPVKRYYKAIVDSNFAPCRRPL